MEKPWLYFQVEFELVKGWELCSWSYWQSPSLVHHWQAAKKCSTSGV